MKAYEETIQEEGSFEEVGVKENNEPGGQKAPNRPDFRVVQVETDKNGNTTFSSVGGMWKNVSKAGNEFYTLKIGNLKLLVFPNKNK